jgi:hypothetical protein
VARREAETGWGAISPRQRPSLVLAEPAKEDANWKELSVSTDFAGLAEFSQDTHRQDAVRRELQNTSYSE